MMNKEKKGEYIGMLGALLVHLAVVALLILITITVTPPNDEAGGVPVMLGNTDMAEGMFDPATMTEVDLLPEAASAAAEAQTEEISEQDLITQAEEETVTLKPKTEAKKPEVKKPVEVKKPEKTEAEKRAEAQRLAEEQAERERKAAAEAAAKRVSGAFGKGAQMEGSKGTTGSGTGTQGVPTGNSSTGAMSGVGGYGNFNLSGRSLGEGGLPRPAYNVQEEGTVVVAITVNPAGQVISTAIDRRTNTVSTSLRKAAEDAARKARFNTVDGVNNQAGTITYNFKLR